MRWQTGTLGGLAMLLLAGPLAAQTTAPARLRVAVSILPQAYFVERIGGDRVEVQVLIGPGQSPHAYEPTPRQLAALAGVQVYFTVGVDFETALVPRLRSMFRDLRFVDTRRDIPLRYFTAAESAAGCQDHDHGSGSGHGSAVGHGHEHGPDCRHAPPAAPATQPAGARPDPHFWLNPLHAKTLAATMCATLCELDPAGADTYRRNLAALHADLDRVHQHLSEVLAPLRGSEVFVFHPAFGYFTDAYGLRQVPVEVEGKEPTARQLAALIDRAKAARVRVIFVQPQFAQRAAEAIAQAIGGAVVPMDDLARDYVRNLEDMAAKIRAAAPREAP